MSIEPEKITKEHVLRAIDFIKEKSLALIPSKKYQVLIDGNAYPPKDLLRYAHQMYNGEHSWKKGGGESTNKYLREMGFEIINTEKKNDPVMDLITAYKEKVKENHLTEEKYKWELAKKYQGRPDTDAIDFQKEITSIDYSNLVYPVGKTVINHIAKESPEPYRLAFKNLLNHNTDLSIRVKQFMAEIMRIYRIIDPTNTLPHHHDERTIATILAYNDADRYPFFMDTFYQKYCSLLKIKAKQVGEKYVHYIQLLDDLIEDYIESDIELIELVRKFIPGDAAEDKSHYILAQDILYQMLFKTGKTASSTGKEISEEKRESASNIILYGPPGTGKTYTTIEKSLELLGEETNGKSHAELKKVFDARLAEGRIVFTSFHQSMSYEDFVEGLKPQADGETEAGISYEVEPGIFRLLCDRARSSNVVIEKPTNIDFQKTSFYKMSLGGKQRPDVHDWCIKNNRLALGWGGFTDLSSYSQLKSWIPFRDAMRKDFPELHKESSYHIQAAFIFQKMKKGDIVVVSRGNYIVDSIGIIRGDYFYEETSEIDFVHFRNVEWIANDLSMSPELLIRKKISQQSIYEFYSEDVKKEEFQRLFGKADLIKQRMPFVLIIDEINRGNVAQIFGELISLLEPDKRQGEREALEVTLPYSKEKFSVPANLHILGTMNTADRSVEALDAALRRRFRFSEMPPRYDLPELEFDVLPEFTCNELLQVINERLEKLLDRDHLIGHSYFIGCKKPMDLKDVFKFNIIPLLQEYFYGDNGKIGLVLGKEFVLERSHTREDRKTFADFDYEMRYELEEKRIFEIRDTGNMDEQAFLHALEVMVNR